MSDHKRRALSDDEQHILEHSRLLLLTRPEDVTRCDQLIVEHRYKSPGPAAGSPRCAEVSAPSCRTTQISPSCLVPVIQVLNRIE